MGIYLLVIMVISGHFTTYSYIEPFIIQISQFSPDITTLMLFVFGLAGVVGSFFIRPFVCEKFKKIYRFCNGFSHLPATLAFCV